MSLSTPAKNTAYYRRIDFVGARILQAGELNKVQTFEQTRSDNTLGQLYADGATLNVTLTVNPTSVTLSPTDATLPMRVFVNGSFEPIPAPGGSLTVNYTPKTSGYESVYLSWVLWKVTKDGDGNSIADPDLKDPSGEPIGEAGQLQVIVAGTSYHTEPLDPTGMLDKNLEAVQMFRFAWQPDATLSQIAIANANEAAWGDEGFYGLVALSTAASGVACSTADPRLSDNRTPLDLSVNTEKVTLPVMSSSGGYGTEYPVLATSPGILSARLLYETTRTTVKTFLDWLKYRVELLLGTSEDHEDRITALENREPPSMDLSFHIGKPIGLADTHPSYTTVTDKIPFRFVSTKPSSQGVMAMGVYNNYQPNGGLDHFGDYWLKNPQWSNPYKSFAQLAQAFYHYTLLYPEGPGGGGGFSTLAGDATGAVTNTVVERLRGKTLPNPGAEEAGYFLGWNGSGWEMVAPPDGGEGVSNLTGDVTGPATGTSVVKLRGRAIASTAPETGQALLWNGSQWGPGTLAQSTTGTLAPGGSYNILNFGAHKIAFGEVTFVDGDVLPAPAGFTWTAHSVAPAICVIGNPLLPLKVEYEYSSHTFKIWTWENGQLRREGRNGAYGKAFVMFLNVS